jgi:glutamate-1-semialdehyde 2,1-aminomutase
VAKAEGTYHGTYDYAEISQNAGPENWGPREQPNPVPVARGTPQGVLQDVVVFPFNDLSGTLTLLDQNRGRLACVLVDLVPQRAGLIPADREYIHGLRQWTREHDVLLIFDEVISFRMGYCGAAEGYGVHPDITTLGKIIGGGFPIGGLAGKQEIMAVMDPTQADLPLPWSGTFSANPISMTAGRVAMELFDRAAIERINALGEYTRCQIAELMEAMQLTACVTGVGSMFRIHPRREAPHDYRSTWQDPDQLRQTQQLVDTMYQRGYLMFRTATAALSTATTKADIDQYLVHLSESMAKGLRDV